MIPVVTPKQVKAIDAHALELESLDVILERVGEGLARELMKILGGVYGRRVNALIGPGLNGADAEVAAQSLERRGVRVRRISFADMPATLPPADLTLDGLFGIGIDRPFDLPDPGDTPIVAVDIPSGIDGLTGEVVGEAFRADITLTLMALKSGLVLGAGVEHAGEVRIVDIGLYVDEHRPDADRADFVEDSDVSAWLPERARDAHKWTHAVLVAAGSPGMTGASHLVSRAAMRTGAGYVHLDSAASVDPGVPTEVVSSLAGKGVRADPNRFSSVVVGPGLGREQAAGEFVRAVLGSVQIPRVVDGDGLNALVDSLDLIAEDDTPTVLTPHDGEFERLMGERPGPDRIASARDLARRSNSVVLLKGPTTIVATPDGRALLTATGDARLATAGTGDVLAGMTGALLAQGLSPLRAAAAAAHLHGRAASLGPRIGLIASDLPDLIPAAIASL